MTLFSEVKEDKIPLIENMVESSLTRVGEGWNQIFNKDLLYNSMEGIWKRVQQGETIHPKSSFMFRAFEECKFSKLKVVFVGQDPYHQPGVADGMAFSCGRTQKEQPSLKFIFDEVQRTAHHYKFVRQPDLTRWANQGILLMNTALSVKEYTPDSHTEIWNPFIRKLLKDINDKSDGLIFVFFGRKAQAFMNLIDNHSHECISVVHPAAAAHRGGVWDCEDLFNKINTLLVGKQQERIIW